MNHIKVSKLEENIDNLTNKVKAVEEEKKNYKQRLLLAEGSIQNHYEPIDFRKISDNYYLKQKYLESHLNSQEGAAPFETDPNNYLAIMNNQNLLEL